MKIEKLPSGTYRVRRTISGKAVSVTFPYKPSQKEALKALEDKWSGRDRLRMTFDQAAQEYIKGKKNTISPSTVRGYESIRKNLPDVVKNRQLEDLTAWDVQKYINDLSKDHTPKTVRNHHAFISAILATFNPNLTLNTQLPQKTVKQPYLPSDDDIKRILEAVAGTEYEIPFRLACYGLRRSEICALTPDDLEGDILTINKALVEDDKKHWHIKTTKTTNSTRQIIIDSSLSALIRSQNRIYDGHPGKLYKALQMTLKSLNIPSFPFHGFRHYYATTAHAIGMPDAVVMASGGWKTDAVMKRIYRHEKQDQVTEMQKKYAAQFHDNI